MLEPMGATSKWDFARRGIALFVEGLAGDSADLHLFGKTSGNDPSVDCSVASYTAPDLILEPGAVAATTFAALGPRCGWIDAERPRRPRRRAPRGRAVVRHRPSQHRRADHGTRARRLRRRARRDICRRAGSTHVIGLDANFDIDPVAEASGTRPFMLKDGDGPERLRDALRHILAGGGMRSCESGFVLDPPPAGTAIDYALTRFAYDDFEIPRVASAAACSQSAQGGFYLDDPVAPTKLSVCPCTCARTSGCGSAQLLFFCQE